MDTTVAQWESSVNTIPKLPMGYKSPMMELAALLCTLHSFHEFRLQDKTNQSNQV